MKAAKLLKLLEADAPNFNQMPAQIGNLMSAFDYTLAQVGQNQIYTLSTKDSQLVATYDLERTSTTLGDAYKSELQFYQTDPDSQSKINQLIGDLANFFHCGAPNYDAAVRSSQ